MKVKVKASEKDPLAPRPVHPRAIIHHGFFGKTYLKQHMMIDPLWSPNKVTEEFQRMAELLAKRMQFNSLERITTLKRISKQSSALKKQCRDGRKMFKRDTESGNTQVIRNILINHKDKQRLYQKMPVNLVVDNINQSTFVMRKLSDRLAYRLKQLKASYNRLLVEKGNLEKRITYQNEFVLEEEDLINDLQRKIRNSNTRLDGIKVINRTYMKMKHILQHDEIFYEPILKSLDRDIEDQAAFVKHILYLGTPAISRFRELSEEYWQMEDKTRRSISTTMQTCTNYRKDFKIRPPKDGGAKPDEIYRFRSYKRETRSMLNLKYELEDIEKTIKNIKLATLCSQSTTLYSRIKSQVDNNLKLRKKIEKKSMRLEALETKVMCSTVLEGVLHHNLAEEELERLEKTERLQNAIKEADAEQEEMLGYIKMRAAAFVLFRYSLWNIMDILRHIDPKRAKALKYPNQYLKMPLLKFENFNMKAVAPEPYEENLAQLLENAQSKLRKLLAYNKTIPKDQLSPGTVLGYCKKYAHDFVQSIDYDDDDHTRSIEEEIDAMADIKALQGIPNHKSIKSLSARIMEDNIKKQLE